MKEDPESFEGKSKGLTRLERFQFAPLGSGYRTLFTGPQQALDNVWEMGPLTSLVLALHLCSCGPA